MFGQRIRREVLFVTHRRHPANSIRFLVSSILESGRSLFVPVRGNTSGNRPRRVLRLRIPALFCLLLLFASAAWAEAVQAVWTWQNDESLTCWAFDQDGHYAISVNYGGGLGVATFTNIPNSTITPAPAGGFGPVTLTIDPISVSGLTLSFSHSNLNSYGSHEAAATIATVAVYHCGRVEWTYLFTGRTDPQRKQDHEGPGRQWRQHRRPAFGRCEARSSESLVFVPRFAIDDGRTDGLFGEKVGGRDGIQVQEGEHGFALSAHVSRQTAAGCVLGACIQ